MFHFGFSYVGLIYLLMMFIPNIIWTKHKPKDYEQYLQGENKILQIFEKAGEILVCVCVLVFSDFNIRFDSLWSLWLLISFLLMILYEIYWIRYFRSEKNMQDFYKSLCGIPVAGATLPVFAFWLLGLYGCNVFLMISTIVLGIGHIGIHLSHYKKISKGIRKKSMLLCILKWVLGILLFILLSAAIVIIGCRNLNYLRTYIHTDKGINESIYVPIGDQEQYLLIQGKDITNPVIIWLHGGPAGADSYANYMFERYLVDDYTIVNWNQRGCGRTYYHNMAQDPLNQTASFEQAQADLDELVDYVANRFHTDKVIIVGHSYGTMLGSRYVLNHPDKVSAYIGIGQVVSIESDSYSFEDALKKATALGDDTKEMESAYQVYLKDKSLINMLNLRKYSNKYHDAKMSGNIIFSGLTSPNIGINDIRWFLKQSGDPQKYISLNQQLFDYIMETDVREYGLDYQIPVGFISGANDWTTPVKYTEDYYQIINAPNKKLSLVDGCMHTPQYDSPKEFCKIFTDMLDSLIKE